METADEFCARFWGQAFQEAWTSSAIDAKTQQTDIQMAGAFNMLTAIESNRRRAMLEQLKSAELSRVVAILERLVYDGIKHAHDRLILYGRLVDAAAFYHCVDAVIPAAFMFSAPLFNALRAWRVNAVNRDCINNVYNALLETAAPLAGRDAPIQGTGINDKSAPPLALTHLEEVKKPKPTVTLREFVKSKGLRGDNATRAIDRLEKRLDSSGAVPEVAGIKAMKGKAGIPSRWNEETLEQNWLPSGE